MKQKQREIKRKIIIKYTRCSNKSAWYCKKNLHKKEISLFRLHREIKTQEDIYTYWIVVESTVSLLI